MSMLRAFVWLPCLSCADRRVPACSIYFDFETSWSQRRKQSFRCVGLRDASCRRADAVLSRSQLRVRLPCAMSAAVPASRPPLYNTVVGNARRSHMRSAPRSLISLRRACKTVLSGGQRGSPPSVWYRGVG